MISLYVRDKTSPLPSLEEVFICNHNTTVEEVSKINEFLHMCKDHEGLHFPPKIFNLTLLVPSQCFGSVDRVQSILICL